MENDEILVEEIQNEDLTKEQLVKQANDLHKYVENLESQIKAKNDQINNLNESMNNLAKSAEHIIHTLSERNKSVLASIWAVMNSLQTLLEEPDYSAPKKEEK